MVMTVWVFWIEPNAYEISRHKRPSKKALAKPLRILHLSDTHFSGRNPRLSGFFDRLAKEPVDFVFVTGDILDSGKGIGPCIENFKKLKPKHGFYAVFGNHDYYDYLFRHVFITNAPKHNHPKDSQPHEEFQKELTKAGIQLLKNETHEVVFDGTPFLIHGLDDPVTDHADFDKIKRAVQPEKINFLLTHTVDAFFYLEENQIDFSFSGHSHGGQVRLPGFGAIITHTYMGREYAGGIRPLKGAICSISRGLGASRFFWMRFFCRPEAIILEIENQKL